MSKLYAETFKNKKPTKAEFRKFNSRPGSVDENGNIKYTTEQAHKEACNIQNVIKKHSRNSLLQLNQAIENQYGDVTGIDFQNAHDLVINAQQAFNGLPSEIRKRFANDPKEYFTFMEDSNNREEAIKLGLIKNTTKPETDGLGEHVKDGKVVTPSEAEPAPEEPA